MNNRFVVSQRQDIISINKIDLKAGRLKYKSSLYNLSPFYDNMIRIEIERRSWILPSV